MVQNLINVHSTILPYLSNLFITSILIFFVNLKVIVFLHLIYRIILYDVMILVLILLQHLIINHDMLNLYPQIISIKMYKIIIKITGFSYFKINIDYIKIKFNI